jgi:hypothetical protein
MLMRDDPTTRAEDALAFGGADAGLAAVLLQDGDGYRCLAALGDDLSLGDAELLDLDDLLPA